MDIIDQVSYLGFAQALSPWGHRRAGNTLFDGFVHLVVSESRHFHGVREAARPGFQDAPYRRIGTAVNTVTKGTKLVIECLAVTGFRGCGDSYR